VQAKNNAPNKQNSEVNIALYLKLCFTHYTAFKMNNSVRNFLQSIQVDLENAEEPVGSQGETMLHYHKLLSAKELEHKEGHHTPYTYTTVR